MLVVSDKVVCTDNTPCAQFLNPRRVYDLSLLEVGQTYVVREVAISNWARHPMFGPAPYGILLEGVDSCFTFHPARFRRLEETEPKKQKSETNHKIGAPKGRLP